MVLLVPDYVIKGNDRLETLRLMILSGEATESEQAEFTLGYDLYCLESQGTKLYHSEAGEAEYKRWRALRKANITLRESHMSN